MYSRFLEESYKFRWYSHQRDCFEFFNLTEKFAPIYALPDFWSGLKDKTGKDIYANDLVIVKHRDFLRDIHHKAVVKFERGCFFVTGEHHNDNDYPLYSFKEEEIEVIGNAYQDVDLFGEIIKNTEWQFTPPENYKTVVKNGEKYISVKIKEQGSNRVMEKQV